MGRAVQCIKCDVMQLVMHYEIVVMVIKHFVVCTVLVVGVLSALFAFEVNEKPNTRIARKCTQVAV